jgi:chemotaxis protein MotB
VIRRTPPPSGDPAAQWQTIYCSLILLLVVFFIMLLSYSAIDRERFGRIQGLPGAPAARSAPAAETEKAMAALEQMAGDAGLGDQFALARTPQGFKAVLSNPLLFPAGEASLSEAGRVLLDGILSVARTEGWSLRVEGHTDNRPIETAQYPSNWELSTLRAVNVLRYFQDQGGIPSYRLAAVGFAEQRPLAGNDTPEGRRQNRRIEILFRTGI